MAEMTSAVIQVADATFGMGCRNTTVNCQATVTAGGLRRIVGTATAQVNDGVVVAEELEAVTWLKNK